MMQTVYIYTMKINEAITLIGDAAALLPRPGQAQHWADLGCGSGLFTEALTRILPAGSTVDGVDTQPDLPHAGQFVPPLPAGSQLRPITADFEKDELALRHLDGILMANSLHYVQDKPALIKKLRGYMRPDAPFLIVEYDTDTPVARWVPYPVSAISLTNLFTQAGYTHIRQLGRRPSVYGRANIYAALIL